LILLPIEYFIDLVQNKKKEYFLVHRRFSSQAPIPDSFQIICRIGFG